MQKSQLLGKCGAGSNYGPRTTSYVINYCLMDYVVKSKYSKVLQTALYQQNYVVFLVPKGRGFDPRAPLGVLPVTCIVQLCYESQISF